MIKPLLKRLLALGCLFWVLACPGWAQSEAESSQSILRITQPAEDQSWDVHVGARATLKTSNGAKVVGRIAAIHDSTLVMHGQEIPLTEVASLQMVDGKRSNLGLILLLLSIVMFLGAAFILLLGILSPVWVGSVLLTIAFFMTLLFGVMLNFFGLVAVLSAPVHYRSNQGWRMQRLQQLGLEDLGKVVRVPKKR